MGVLKVEGFKDCNVTPGLIEGEYISNQKFKIFLFWKFWYQKLEKQNKLRC